MPGIIFSKIISGGQTGVDRAALDVARILDVKKGAAGASETLRGGGRTIAAEERINAGWGAPDYPQRLLESQLSHPLPWAEQKPETSLLSTCPPP